MEVRWPRCGPNSATITYDFDLKPVPTFFLCIGWELGVLFPGSGGNEMVAHLQDGTSQGGIAQEMSAMADIPSPPPPIPDLSLLMDPFG